MSAEKIERNRKVYLDKIKVTNGKEMTWRALEDKWGLSVGVLRAIVKREHKKALK